MNALGLRRILTPQDSTRNWREVRSCLLVTACHHPGHGAEEGRTESVGEACTDVAFYKGYPLLPTASRQL